jgi:hypothetical protein
MTQPMSEMKEFNEVHFGYATLIPHSITVSSYVKDLVQMNWDKVPIDISLFLSGAENPRLTGLKSLEHLVSLIATKDYTDEPGTLAGANFKRLLLCLNLLEGHMVWKGVNETVIVRIQCSYPGDSGKMIDYLAITFSQRMGVYSSWERAILLSPPTLTAAEPKSIKGPLEGREEEGKKPVTAAASSDV